MTKSIESTANKYINDLKTLLDQLDTMQLTKAEKLLTKIYRSKGKVFVIGNGGSASTASHIACDLSKGIKGKRGKKKWNGFRTISLSDNVPIITAWSNDVSFEKIYSEQIKSLGEKGDLLIAISSSGNSQNILNGVKEAKKLGIKVITLAGFGGGKLSKLGNVNIVTHHNEYGQVEDIQLILNHIFVIHFKNKLAKK